MWSDVTGRCTRSSSSKYVVYATACVYREWKITDRKKKKIEFDRERERPLSAPLTFKWTNQDWGWNHPPSGRCRGPYHKRVRKAEEVNFEADFKFRSSRVFRPPKHTYLWNLLGSMELLVLLRFGTFPFEEKAICGVTSGQRWIEWSAFPFRF